MFSIIVPTYNQDNLLKKCLESVVNQTFENWEVIIINNHSKDETLKVIQSFDDDRIKSRNFRNNGIIAASRNYGINLAKFPYISFLDSDDFWLPKKLEKSFSYLTKGNDIVCHDEIWIWPDGTKKLVNYGPEENTLYKNLLFKGNVISTSAFSCKKNLILDLNGFNESPLMAGNEDYDLWMRISKIGKYKFKFIQEPLGYYRIHQNNNSKKLLKQLKTEIYVINEHYKGSKFSESPFNYLKFFLRIIKALFGSIIKSNEFIYKTMIKIRK
tara:strand:+ start:6295 stop:7104 length:810 start_codon:yes stop_codon:yes gene_type:complete